MFKAFIIDDDTFAVDAVYMMFPWDELNIGNIEKIYSSENLVKKILTEKPHVVFIDIELFDVSGLDIIKKCRENNSDALFIIISGHDNFKYAREAVNLNVLYYLLKPLDPTDVTNATQKLKNALSEQLYSESFNHMSSDKVFCEWLAHDLSFLEEYRLILGDMPPSERSKIEKILGSSLRSCHKLGSKRYTFIVSDKLFDENVKQKLTKYVAERGLVLGVSSPFSEESKISDCFRQANILSYNYFIRQKNELAYIEPINQIKIRQIIDTLLRYIEDQSANEIKLFLSAMPELFISEHYTIEQSALLYNTVIGKINLAYNTISHSATLSQMSEDDLFIYFQTFKNLCNSLWDYFCVSVDIEPDFNDDSQSLWSNISSFIEENYHEKLRVQDICNNFFISQRTFFKAFKSNTSETFVEYLTRIRINKSKELLISSELSLPEIADAVGIGDYYYFNKIFKKVTGITPLKFRKQGGMTDV